MLVMFESPSSRMPTLRVRGSNRASFLSTRACCSRKKGAMVAMGQMLSCSTISDRSAVTEQPTSVPGQGTMILGHVSLRWDLRSNRRRSTEQCGHKVNLLGQLVLWCSCKSRKVSFATRRAFWGWRLVLTSKSLFIIEVTQCSQVTV